MSDFIRCEFQEKVKFLVDPRNSSYINRLEENFLGIQLCFYNCTQDQYIKWFSYTTKVLTELTPGASAIKDGEIRDWVNQTLEANNKTSKISSFKVIRFVLKSQLQHIQ